MGTTLLIGEKINTSRKEVQEAVSNMDAVSIRKLAREQAEAGAHYIDVNCGTFLEREAELMTWMVNEIQEEVDKPLCIDSPNPKALRAGLSASKNGQPMINSISGEKERYEQILPLVLEYNAKIVALCMDNKGIPQDAERRVEIASKLIRDMEAAGVERDNIYVDPLIQPISTSTENALSAIRCMEMVLEKYPGVHITCGLSNISFGLPKRQLINQTFMVMCMLAGLDSIILDPSDKRMMALVKTSEMLLNKDPYSISYLKAYRQKLLDL